LNSHDLTLAAFQGNAEKIPFNPFIMHLAATLVGADYSHDYCQHAETLASAQIKCAEFFGIDHVNVSTDAYHEASAWGVEVDWEGNTPDGKTFLNIEEFDQIETPDLASDPRIIDRVKGVQLLKEQTHGNQCVFGWIEAPFAELCCLFGITNVFLMARHPDWEKHVRKIIDRIVPIQLEFAQMQIEAGADVIGAGDSIISQIGPRWYQQCSVDSTQNLFTDIKRQVPVLYHICGDNSIIDSQGRDMLQLIGSTGANAFDFDMQVNLKIAREKIGPTACIRGNTNTQILGNPDYSIEQVIEEIKNTMQLGLSIQPYMYAAGCEWPWIPRDMAIRNLTAAKTICENFGR
jgi:uroporphyrinogen-III decarboxylase